MDRRLNLALQIWDWESPNPGATVEETERRVGNMISWDDKLRMWRIHGKAPRVVYCPLCDEVMTHCPVTPEGDDERWVCLNISSHQEALDDDRMPGLRLVFLSVSRLQAQRETRLLQPRPRLPHEMQGMITWRLASARAGWLPRR